MNSAKVYDPEQSRAEYIEARKRQRRVQYPPLSYWQKYAEMTDEDEFCQAVTEVMDKMMKPFLYFVVPVGIVALVTHYTHMLWLPPALCIAIFVWLRWRR